MNKGMAQILDDCLDKAVLKTRPEVSLEECLSEYQIVRVDLEPLLRTALYTRESLSMISPAPEFSERALTNLLNRTEQLRAKPKVTLYLPGLSWIEGLGRSIFRRKGWAMAMAGLLALFLAGGTVRASLNASPEQVLYPVKLSTEQVQLKLTSNPEQKARLYMKFAGRRVDEMAMVAEKERLEDIDKLEAKLALNLETAKAITEELKAQPSKAEDAQKLQDELIENASSHITTLRRSISIVPPGSRKQLEIVIDRTLIGYSTPPGKTEEPIKKEEKPAAPEKSPEGKAFPGGEGGRRWEIRPK